MNIGSVGNATKLLEALDPKGNSGFLGKITKDAKLIDEMKKITGQLLGNLGDLEGVLGNLGSDLDKLQSAFKSKAKPSKQDVEATKKALSKMFKDWQANRVKILEMQISSVEKHLANLRKELAAAKGNKPDGWFM